MDRGPPRESRRPSSPTRPTDRAVPARSPDDHEPAPAVDDDLQRWRRADELTRAPSRTTKFQVADRLAGGRLVGKPVMVPAWSRQPGYPRPTRPGRRGPSPNRAAQHPVGRRATGSAGRLRCSPQTARCRLAPPSVCCSLVANIRVPSRPDPRVISFDSARPLHSMEH